MFLAIMVLPRPLVPIRTRLRASLMKSRVRGPLNDVAVDLLRPVPVEVGDHFEAADARALQAWRQRALAAVMPFDANQFFQEQVCRPLSFGSASQKVVDGFSGCLEAEEAQLRSKITVRVLRVHRRSPDWSVERGCRPDRVASELHAASAAAWTSASVSEG